VTAPGAPLLQVTDLHVSYRAGRRRRVDALRGVSVAVGAGEAVGVIGESGSGKSTLARAVLRLVEPTSGSIVLDGTEVTGMAERSFRPLRAKVQMVWQEPDASLDPRMRLGRQLAESLRHSGLPRAEHAERVARSLGEVGLDPSVADRRPGELSGGQAQRACIARALLTDPDVLVLDEPTSALDVTIQAQVLELIAGLMHGRRRGYLYVSHDLATLYGICRRVVVLYLGLVVEEGPIERVFSRPAHPYTRALLSTVPSLGGVPLPDPVRLGRPAEGHAVPPGCPLEDRCPYALPACNEPQRLAPVAGGPPPGQQAQLVACWRAGELPEMHLPLAAPRGAGHD
jgi:oligopeptide/dipeptide ABC transporter ATP-binding protein